MGSKSKELRINREGDRYKWSSGSIIENLQSIGVETELAVDIARDCIKNFRSEKNIDFTKLMTWFEEVLSKQANKEIAETFLSQTPPFIPLKISKDKSTEDYSRRVVSQRLEKQGIPFKEAYDIADQLRSRLRAQGLENITDVYLNDALSEAIETRIGSMARLRFESDNHQVIQIVQSDGQVLPFSHGILSRSLMSIGLDSEMAFAIAREVEQTLWLEPHNVIPSHVLEQLVEQEVTEKAGKSFAQRYQLLQEIDRNQKPIIVLICGTSGVGKSTVAAEIAYRLGIPRLVSSDSIRQALRSLISPDLSAILHSSSFTAWQTELLPGEDTDTVKTKRVHRAFQTQVQQVSAALSAILKRNYEENVSIVMEGVHVVPGFMPLDEMEDATIIELVFVQSDEEKHRQNFEKRQKSSVKRKSNRYLGHFQEIRLVQDFIVSQAKSEGVAIIDAMQQERAIDEGFEIILQSLLNDWLDKDDSNKEENSDSVESS